MLTKEKLETLKSEIADLQKEVKNINPEFENFLWGSLLARLNSFSEQVEMLGTEN